MWAADASGWIGAAALLVAHALVTRDPADAAGRRYRALNLVGSAGLVTSGIAHAAWPSAALNILWLTVGLTALVRRHRPNVSSSRLTTRRPKRW